MTGRQGRCPTGLTGAVQDTDTAIFLGGAGGQQNC